MDSVNERMHDVEVANGGFGGNIRRAATRQIGYVRMDGRKWVNLDGMRILEMLKRNGRESTGYAGD